MGDRKFQTRAIPCPVGISSERVDLLLQLGLNMKQLLDATIAVR